MESQSSQRIFSVLEPGVTACPCLDLEASNHVTMGGYVTTGGHVTMGGHAPTTVQGLSIERLPKKEALAISVLEDLAWTLNPTGFEVAFMNRQTNVLRAIVPTWPFPCLPVGALIKTPFLPQPGGFEGSA